MTTIYKLLKVLTPLVLLIFISAAVAAPVLAQESYEYNVITPTQVAKGDTFELTVSSVKGALDQKNVSLDLPGGFKRVMSAPVVSSDGSLVYKIQAGPTEGDYVIYVQINSSAARSMTLSQKISVQQSFFEKAQPFLIAAGIIAVILLVNGGMARSNGGGSMY